MVTFQPKDIIFVIEEYRKAYMAHHDPIFFKDNRYKPLVSYSEVIESKGPVFTASLYDTWVQIDKYKRFLLGKEPVQNARFSSTTLQMALEELLNFTRVSFMDDKLFNRI